MSRTSLPLYLYMLFHPPSTHSSQLLQIQPKGFSSISSLMSLRRRFLILHYLCTLQFSVTLLRSKSKSLHATSCSKLSSKLPFLLKIKPKHLTMPCKALLELPVESSLMTLSICSSPSLTDHLHTGFLRVPKTCQPHSHPTALELAIPFPAEPSWYSRTLPTWLLPARLQLPALRGHPWASTFKLLLPHPCQSLLNYPHLSSPWLLPLSQDILFTYVSINGHSNKYLTSWSSLLRSMNAFLLHLATYSFFEHKYLLVLQVLSSEVSSIFPAALLDRS